MQVQISIGENHRFELREALLVYGDRQRSFVTRHQVAFHKGAPPTLEPAQPLTLGFLESLVRSLVGGSTAEVLPENVLAKGDRMIARWTAACPRQMFYENSEQKAVGLNGRTFPQPSLPSFRRTSVGGSDVSTTRSCCCLWREHAQATRRLTSRHKANAQAIR